MSERVQVVTGLFNIGREFNDGRSISEYLTHLGALLSCCPDAIVFHDCIDQDFQSNHPSTKFVQLTLSELSIWGLREKISQICSTYLDLGFSDLVYKNTLYGLVIHSKFELLSRSLEFSDACNYLWLDAGVFRFHPEVQKTPGVYLDENMRELELFEISIWKNFSIRQLIIHRRLISPPKVGSSKRVIGAAAFVLNKSAILDFESESFMIVNEWIAAKTWDTEQVLLGQLLKNRSNVRYFLQPKNTPTSIVTVFFRSGKIQSSDFLGEKISRLLL
jgi:hypothetical protein